MFDLKWIRDNPEAFDRGLEARGETPCAQEILARDRERREHVTRLQEAQSRRNAASKEISAAKAAGEEAKAQKLIEEVAELKDTIHAGEDKERELTAELDELLARLPNLPLDDVPVGADESANVEHHSFGAPPGFDFAPKQHFEIGEALGLMDFETAARLSGSRFVVLKGALARMERALARFMLDLHTKEFCYEEVSPPLLVRDEAAFGTGQLPKFEDDLFFALSFVYSEDQKAIALRINELLKEHAALRGQIQDRIKQNVRSIKTKLDPDLEGELLKAAWDVLDELVKDSEKQQRQIIELQQELGTYVTAFSNKRWLIPTAEVPLTNLVREQILEEAELPMRVTAFTPCFRAEAGAAGKDTRGMIRQHQFSKVELVSIVTPEQSLDELERMTACAEEVLRRLGLHYRVMVLSTGDMGFAARKTYDIEVWLPGQDTYREISSCSLCGDFQARRMNARYRSKDNPKDIRFVQTLNGSGLAVGRTLIAVLENYQREDGTVLVPEALRPYMDGEELIAAGGIGL